MAIESSSVAAVPGVPGSIDELSVLLRQQCSRVRECVAEWSQLHQRMIAPVEELIIMMERFQPMQVPLMSSLIQRIHSHRYTATAAVAAFSAHHQRTEPSTAAHTTFLHSLCPSPTTRPSPCTVGDYVAMLCSYSDMYEVVYETSRLLLGAVLAQCARALAEAASMSPAAAAVQCRYALVWTSGCGRDVEREEQLDRRWKEDREWRKAESDRTAERKSAGSSGATAEPKSVKKRKKQSKQKP